MVIGLIVEVFLLLFFVCSAVYNGLSIAESEAYFTFESVIDGWGVRYQDFDFDTILICN